MQDELQPDREIHVPIYNPDKSEIRGAAPYNSQWYTRGSDI